MRSRGRLGSRTSRCGTRRAPWLGLLLLAAGPATAQVDVSASPPRASIGARAAATPVTVVWNVRLTAPPAVNVVVGTTSGPGLFVGERSGRVLGQLPSLGARPGSITSFPETFTVPQGVLDAAQQTDEQRIVLARTFRVVVTFTGLPGPPVTQEFAGGGSVAISLGSGPGAPFAVYRVALRFDPGGTQVVAEDGEEVVAWADLAYDGTGLLRATWELAEPATTAGVPVFRPLRLVRRFLGAGGRVSLKAPPLPTRQPGIHLLQLRVETPPPQFDPPRIRYAVTGGVGSRRVVLGGPAPHALLAPDLRFHWAPVAGATAYRLEVLAPAADVGGEAILFDDRAARYEDLRGPDGAEVPFERPGATARALEGAGRTVSEPVLRVLVPGREAQLSAANRRHLDPGRSYVWRVVALGGSGEELGRSELRRLHVPVPTSGAH